MSKCGSFSYLENAMNPLEFLTEYLSLDPSELQRDVVRVFQRCPVCNSDYHHVDTPKYPTKNWCIKCHEAFENANRPPSENDPYKMYLVCNDSCLGAFLGYAGYASILRITKHTPQDIWTTLPIRGCADVEKRLINRFYEEQFDIKKNPPRKLK